jgi:integrase
MSRRRANHEGSKPGRRADGRWVVHVMLAGARRSFYGTTAGEARKFAQEAVRDHDRGLDVLTARTRLEDYLQEWLATVVSRRRDNTYRSYEIAVRVHIVPHPANAPLGDIPLGKIRTSHVDAWLVDRQDAGLAPYTVWRLHAVLRAALNRAVRRDPPILARNPASFVDAIDVDRKEIEPLSAQEAREVLAATAGTVDHLLYALDLSLGLRIGELLAVRWAERANDGGIDLERGEVRVYEQLQHGGFAPLKRSWHRRVLRLSPWLLAMLHSHAELLRERRMLAGDKWREHGLVFPSEVGTPRSAPNVWLSWKRLQRRLGLPDHTFHDLRHTAATLALQAGVPLWKVSKMLGHRDLATTARIYAHLTPEGREEVAERMQEVLTDGAAWPTVVKTVVKSHELPAAGAILNLEKVPGGE